MPDVKSFKEHFEAYYVGCAYGKFKPEGKFRETISHDIEITRERCIRRGLTGKIIKVFPTYVTEQVDDIKK